MTVLRDDGMKILTMVTDIDAYYGEVCGEQINLLGEGDCKSCTQYALPLIEIPEGYRLANKEDRLKSKPEGYIYLYNLRDGFKKGWDTVSMVWDENTIYLVPIETEADRKRKEIENEIKEAQYKLEIAQSKLKELN